MSVKIFRNHRQQRRLITVFVALTVGLGGINPSFADYSDSELRAVETPTEQKLREIREQEITQLKIALGRRLDQNRRADLYLRLAEIYLEAYRTDFILEGKVHEKRVALKSGERLDRGRSKKWLKKGIEVSEQLLKSGLQIASLDKVLYFLGYHYGELGEEPGNEEKSRRYFQELIRRFPQSPLCFDAYQTLGEWAYQERDFNQAVRYFDDAIRIGGGEVTPRVYHKRAWAYYRLKKYDLAVDSMKAAIAGAGGSQERFLSLREEALRDLAIFMTETGRVDEAIDYFKRASGDSKYYARTLEKLGKQYERSVQPEKAMKVYESLLSTNPEDQAAFRVRVKLIDLDLRSGRYQDALTRLKERKVLMEGEPETVQTYQNLKAMIRRTAVEQHENFRKKSVRPSLNVSESFYDAYLSQFLLVRDLKNEVPEIRMYLAEVKRELGKPKEAAGLYRLVVESGDPRYQKDAPALWVQTLFDAIKKAPVKKIGGTSEPSALEKEFVEATDDLQELLGDQMEGREAALRAAQVLAGYPKTLKEAEKRAWKIIEKTPNSAQALKAAELLFQLVTEKLPSAVAELSQSEAGEALMDLVDDLKKHPELLEVDQKAQGKLKKNIDYYEDRIKIGKIARLEKEQDFDAAGLEYERYAQNSKDLKLAEKAYENAVQTYMRVDEMEAAVRVLDQWTTRVKKSAALADTIRWVATQTLIAGRAEESGDFFRRVGGVSLNAAQQEEALWTASRVFAGAAVLGKAREVWIDLLKNFPQSPRRAQVYLYLIDSYFSEDQEATAESYLMSCWGESKLQKSQSLECLERGVSYFFLKGKSERLERWLKEGLKTKLKKGESSAVLGYFQWIRLHQTISEYDPPPLSLPEKSLEAALTHRLKFLEIAKRQSDEILKTSGPWGVASWSLLARTAFGMGEDVESLLHQPDLKKASLLSNEMKKVLLTVAGAFKKKAVELDTQVVKRSGEWDLLLAASVESQDRLTQSLGSKVGRAQGPRPTLPVGESKSIQLGRWRVAQGEGGQEDVGAIRRKLASNPKKASLWFALGNHYLTQGRMGLARVCYDFVEQLEPQHKTVKNNQALAFLAGSGVDQWGPVSEGMTLLRSVRALSEEARWNSFQLDLYYRNFPRAELELKSFKSEIPPSLKTELTRWMEWREGKKVDFSPEKLEALNEGDGFFAAFHSAEQSRRSGEFKKCRTVIEDLSLGERSGLERWSAERLLEVCEREMNLQESKSKEAP